MIFSYSEHPVQIISMTFQLISISNDNDEAPS